MMSRPLMHFILLAIIPYVFAQIDASYDGGIPLRTPDSTCPAGSVSGGVSLQLNCCGTGQTHESMSTGSYCCPNASNCSAEVIAVPKCADPSWQLCESNIAGDLGFCCEADWLCFIQLPIPGNGGGVGCSTPGASLGLSQIEASTQYAANAGPGVSTTSSSTSAAPTSTTTDSGIGTTSSSVGQTTSTGSSTVTPPVTSSQSSSRSSSGTGTGRTSGSQTTSFTSGTVTGPASESQTSSSATSSTTPLGTTTAAAGLSTGAKIGIGVAVPLALIAAIFGGFLFGKRRRQEGGETSPTDYTTYKWPQVWRKHTVTKSELADTGIAEMGDNTIAEMEDTRRHEMEGEGHHAAYAYQQQHIERKGVPQY